MLFIYSICFIYKNYPINPYFNIYNFIEISVSSTKYFITVRMLWCRFRVHKRGVTGHYQVSAVSHQSYRAFLYEWSLEMVVLCHALQNTLPSPANLQSWSVQDENSSVLYSFGPATDRHTLDYACWMSQVAGLGNIQLATCYD